MNQAAEKVRAAMDAGQYEQGADQALKDASGSIRLRLSDTKKPHWADRAEGYRPHWRVTMKGPGGRYTFDFWDSLNNGQAGAPTPRAHDVIACLQWYEPGTFADFCEEYGYDQDSRTAERTYKAVKRQAEALARIFPDEATREALAEIR